LRSGVVGGVSGFSVTLQNHSLRGCPILNFASFAKFRMGMLAARQGIYALREAGIVEIESKRPARHREQETYGGQPRIFLRPEPALSLSKG